VSAVHAADEQLTLARSRSDLVARVPVLRADLTRLLDRDDPRRRDVLRLLDRVMEEEERARHLREHGDEQRRLVPQAAGEPTDVEPGRETIDEGLIEWLRLHKEQVEEGSMVVREEEAGEERGRGTGRGSREVDEEEWRQEPHGEGEG
jgi:hypothetical protein